jgi:putative ABC transport system permease protein
LKSGCAKATEGRFFDAEDRAGGRQVVIVDEVLARQTWPGLTAIGRKIEVEQFHNGRFEPAEAQVVGVIRHIQHHGLTKVVRGQIYIPYAQSSRPHLSYAVRTRGDPQELAAAVRRELAALDKRLAVSAMQPMERYVERAAAPASFTAVLAGIFGALAVTLAAIGVYGVISYPVGRRTHELGVRMALGAIAGQVQRMVLKEGLAITAAGLLLGMAGSLALSGWLSALLFGVSASDPETYAAALAAVLLAALAACWLPARRAASVHPVQALRVD